MTEPSAPMAGTPIQPGGRSGFRRHDRFRVCFPAFKDAVSFWAVTAFVLGTIYFAEVVSAIVLIRRSAQ